MKVIHKLVVVMGLFLLQQSFVCAHDFYEGLVAEPKNQRAVEQKAQDEVAAQIETMNRANPVPEMSHEAAVDLLNRKIAEYKAATEAKPEIAVPLDTVNFKTLQDFPSQSPKVKVSGLSDITLKNAQIISPVRSILEGTVVLYRAFKPKAMLDESSGQYYFETASASPLRFYFDMPKGKMQQTVKYSDLLFKNPKSKPFENDYVNYFTSVKGKSFEVEFQESGVSYLNIYKGSDIVARYLISADGTKQVKLPLISASNLSRSPKSITTVASSPVDLSSSVSLDSGFSAYSKGSVDLSLPDSLNAQKAGRQNGFNDLSSSSSHSSNVYTSAQEFKGNSMFSLDTITPQTNNLSVFNNVYYQLRSSAEPLEIVNKLFQVMNLRSDASSKAYLLREVKSLQNLIASGDKITGDVYQKFAMALNDMRTETVAAPRAPQ